MLKKNRIYSPSFRKRKAYSTAIRVFISYYWLFLKRKLFGQAYYDRNIKKVHLRNANRIKNRLQELQGLFIKVGQLISNLSNVLPEEFRAPLQSLQDHNISRPYAEIEEILKKELKNSSNNIYKSFNPNSLASASIGQVHIAEIKDTKVVVKVQHKHIEKIAKADLNILENLVKLHALLMNMDGLDHMYEQVKLMIEEELDYTKEAQSMIAISENLKEVPELNIGIPQVFETQSTSKVLTSTFFDGVNISNIETLNSWNIDKHDLAKRLIELYCRMIFVDGLYHADPHPGNILIEKTGKIVLLDFGAVASLKKETKKAFSELIESIVKNDTDQIVISLRKMGFLGSDKASKRFVEKLIRIFKEFLSEEVEFDGMNFQNIKLNSGMSSLSNLIKKVDLRDVSQNIKIPKEYILLNRTIVLLLGVVFQLAPDLDILQVVRPYLKKHVLDKELGFTQMIVNTFKSQVTTAISLPRELSQFLKETKETDIEAELIGIKGVLSKIYNLGKQILYSLILSSLLFFKLSADYSKSTIVENILWVSIGLFGFLLLRSIYKDLKD